MFGTNPIHGKKTFAKDPPDTLRVTSVFFTLQGEGPLSGQPSMFVRLAHCNLNCAFCDTEFERYDLYTYAELELLMCRRIVQFFGGDFPPYAQWLDARPRQINLVITGGEPLLQDNLHPFIHYMNHRRSYIEDAPVSAEYQRIQIETNGILPWRGDESTMLIVSPKAVQSNGVPVRLIDPHPFSLQRANALKFVIQASGEGLNPYNSVPRWAEEWSARTGRPVYVSPMAEYFDLPRAALLAKKTGADADINVRSEVLERISLWDDGVFDKERTRRNYEYAAVLAMRRGYLLSLQTHLMASLP